MFTVKMQRQHAERSLNNPLHALNPFFLHIKRKSHSASPSTGPGAAGRKLLPFLVSLPCSKLHLPSSSTSHHITSGRLYDTCQASWLVRAAHASLEDDTSGIQHDTLGQGIVLLQHVDGLVHLPAQSLRRLQQKQQLAIVHLQQHTCTD